MSKTRKVGDSNVVIFGIPELVVMASPLGEANSALDGSQPVCEKRTSQITTNNFY